MYSKTVYTGRHTASTRRGTPRKKRRIFLVASAVLILAALGLGGWLLLRPSQPAIAGPPWVVALDAGHGGTDLGATGLIDEVELTERTVALLYSLLAADPDFAPVLIRQPGEGMGVNERAAAARQAGAVLLLSVHGNADTSADSYGFECFPVPPGRTWHGHSLRLANLLAQHMGQAGARLRGEGGVRYAYYSDSTTKFIREASDNAVYAEKSFGVLEQPDCVALLVEQCFVTNPGDVAQFAGEAGCALAAECYYQAIKDFFGTL